MAFLFRKKGLLIKCLKKKNPRSEAQAAWQCGNGDC